MLLEEGLVAGWSLQFYFGAFSKCSSRSLCSDRKSNSNGLLIYVSFVQSSVVHIAPSGYVITFEFLIKHFPFFNMWDTIAYWIYFFLKSDRVFYFTLAFLCLQGLFLIYLLLALFIHRKDRKALERIAINREVDVLFIYSWRGVELEISHPTVLRELLRLPCCERRVSYILRRAAWIFPIPVSNPSA